MRSYIHTGYTGIYRPPYSLSDKPDRSTIYCVSDHFNLTLVIIPLVPSFYRDVINIVKNNSAKEIYLIATDIGVGFVSDYYLCWDTIMHKLHRDCKIFSKFMIENFIRSDFKADIIRSSTGNMSLEMKRSEVNAGTIDITLTKERVEASSPFACDLILNDTYKKRLFIGEMNETKAKYINSNRTEYDEIHMPFMTGTYGGLTYLETLQSYPALVTKLYCNQFASYEELQFARSKHVKIGGVFGNDPV